MELLISRVSYCVCTKSMAMLTYRKWSSSTVHPMLFAKRSTSRLYHETEYGSYSCPAPGVLIVSTVLFTGLVL